jgi:glycosyltransferase involved in cell wall biosynthesis
MADARVGVSKGAVEDLARLSRLDPLSFTIIANPISFPAEVKRRADVEAMWGDCGKRILTVGQLKVEKDHALLIRAFARLPRSANAKLMIVGEGDLRPMLLKLAEEQGVADRVSLPGYVVDPWPFYASADLFVLSSREESFGLVLVEALYAGLPIISTATTGASDVLENGRWGWLVPRGDEEGLADILREEPKSAPDRNALRRRAEELSGQATVDAYLSLLLAT